MHPKTILILNLGFFGALGIPVSLPLIFRKVRPNKLYGVRTNKTLSDENIWYEANAYFGKDLLRASIAILIGDSVFFMLRHSLSNPDFLAILLAITFIPYTVIILRIFRYLRRI